MSRSIGAELAGETMQVIAPYAILALILYGVYQWFQSESGQQLLDQVKTNVLPQAVTLGGPAQNPIVGTSAQVTKAGTLVVMINGVPQAFGPNGTVPGTGQTVSDLRNQGFSDADIVELIQNGSEGGF